MKNTTHASTSLYNHWLHVEKWDFGLTVRHQWLKYILSRYCFVRVTAHTIYIVLICVARTQNTSAQAWSSKVAYWFCFRGDILAIRMVYVYVVLSVWSRHLFRDMSETVRSLAAIDISSDVMPPEYVSRLLTVKVKGAMKTGVCVIETPARSSLSKFQYVTITLMDIVAECLLYFLLPKRDSIPVRYVIIQTLAPI